MLYHYADCHSGECHVLFIVMLNVLIQSVIMLSVVAPPLQFTIVKKCIAMAIHSRQLAFPYIYWPNFEVIYKLYCAVGFAVFITNYTCKKLYSIGPRGVNWSDREF
jgi:hypothetical protein